MLELAIAWVGTCNTAKPWSNIVKGDREGVTRFGACNKDGAGCWINERTIDRGQRILRASNRTLVAIPGLNMDEFTRVDHQGWGVARAEGEVVVIARKVVSRLREEG